jgi:hypothetical protein
VEKLISGYLLAWFQCIPTAINTEKEKKKKKPTMQATLLPPPK